MMICFLGQIFLWGVFPDRTFNLYLKSYTIFGFIVNSLRTFFVPEFCSVAILGYYLKVYKKFFGISTTPELQPRAVTVFALQMIPALLTAFFAFAPFTFTVRFLLREQIFSYYIFWDKYLAEVFSFPMYALYLPFVLLVGTGIEVGRLVRKYFRDKDQTALNNVATPALPIEVPVETPKPRREYPLFFKTQGLGGDLRLGVGDIYAIEVDNRYLFARYIGGRGLLGSTKMVENDIDPIQFFRINRKYYINLKFVRKYAYERESNRYRIKLNGEGEEFFMQQKSINAFKSALDAYEVTVFKKESALVNADLQSSSVV